MDSEIDGVGAPALPAPEESLRIIPDVSLDKFSIANLEPETDVISGLEDLSLAPPISPDIPHHNVIDIDQSKTPEPDGEVISEDHSIFLETQANLKRTEERCQELTTQLSERDMMIVTLQRSCGLLEKEATLTKRELEISQREKESAVMRYAIVEKKVIDANLAKDAVEKKLKEGQKEIEALNHKIRQMNAEKTRMCQIVDQKVS